MRCETPSQYKDVKSRKWVPAMH